MRSKLAVTAAAVLALALAAGPAALTAAAPVAPPDQLATPPRVAPLDLNQRPGTLPARLLTPTLRAAVDRFTGEHPGAVVRWDRFGGSPDVVYGFASAPSAAAPETAARDFLAAHADLFGAVDGATLVLDADRSKPALGGYLLRFNQVHRGVPIVDAGFGVVLDGEKRVRAVSGPYYRDVAIDVTPSLGSASAVERAAANLAAFARPQPPQALAVLDGAYALIESQLGPLTTPHPRLTVYPTAGGFRLAWTFLYYTRNPFGLYRYTVDAGSGEVLRRANLVVTQEAPLPFTADYFPTSPPLTQGLKDEGAILDDNGLEIGRPAGQIRVGLRKIDPTSAVTGTEDVITGTHAAIQSALPTKLPFAQAAQGTWHFAQDNPPLEARTDERDQTAEPAEHQDAISQYIYITSLVEYLDYLHKAGDAVHSRGVGEGSFPDHFPNEDTPLTGTVHIPNVLEDICGDLAPVSDPAFMETLLGCDNAFAVPASEEVEGQKVVVNPTFYGHGYAYNDLAIDFAVPLHEGTHSTITPIAGFEGSPEGGALNEGQADTWAYTIGENPALGAYIVNAFRLRQELQAAGVDPDTVKWIRNADSQLRYSQLGTRMLDGLATFEVHRDGEIYAGALWDIRQLMTQFQTGGPYKRPNAVTGEATDVISLGKETWERIFLGSEYVLGTMAPDTMVRARDAMIIADSVLYPADPVDPESPGRHRALIEQVFAARELGIHAEPPLGGRQLISTSVSAFTAGVEKPPAPQGVVATPVSPTAVEVAWQPVDGAFAYQVLKRRAGSTAKRLFTGVPDREYFDGDQPDQLSGFTHVEYVYGGGTTSYLDGGQQIASRAALGLETLDFDYVVRALRANPGGQVGVSDLSGTAAVALALDDVSAAIEARIANVQLSGGVFSFDQTLKNKGGAGQADGTIYTPITFKIVSISHPSITAANADNGGSGQNGHEAHYGYTPALATGQTSAPRNLRFNNPQGKLFTFDALITGRLEVAPQPANGSQPADGFITQQPRPATFDFIEEFTGVVPIGSGGSLLAGGVDHVDVPFTARSSAVGVIGTLSADPAVAFYPDLDFQMLDDQGRVIASSGNFGPDEEVQWAVTGGKTYTYRVVGFANGPTPFKIVSRQLVTDPAEAGAGPSGGATSSPALTQLVRFTANPLTKTVSVQLLD
jgi:Fungalysin metallopeptidase (M36)/Fungalysin/Thermolysin Propeptide Motif